MKFLFLPASQNSLMPLCTAQISVMHISVKRTKFVTRAVNVNGSQRQLYTFSEGHLYLNRKHSSMASNSILTAT